MYVKIMKHLRPLGVGIWVGMNPMNLEHIEVRRAAKWQLAWTIVYYEIESG